MNVSDATISSNGSHQFPPGPDVVEHSPGPLVGFITGLLLSIALWVLVGCGVIILNLLSSCS